MKPIFESTDIFKMLQGQWEGEDASDVVAKGVNAHLSSIGIDAETPLLRLVELERQIAEAPYAYMAKGYGHYDKWTTNFSDLDARPTHRARLIHIEEIKK